MGYKATFMDNEVYTAQDVNEHFSKLFSGGVSLMESGNILADLNGLTGSIADYGVLFDACRVVKTRTGYKISAGSAYMNDGSAITFDADGYEFTASTGKYWYVYLKRNEPENRIDIVVSQNEPTEGSVILAHINTQGEVYDRREFAKLKINTNQANTLRKFNYNSYSREDYKATTINMGTVGFTYFIFLSGKGSNISSNFNVTTYRHNFYPIADGEKLELTIVDNAESDKCMLTVKRTGNSLEVRAYDRTYINSYELNLAVI